MLSEKQKSYLAHSDAFLNVADGSVRSGKTHSTLHKLTNLAITGPPGDFGLFGKTERTVKRNVVLPLQEMHPKGAVRFVQGAGELYLFGRRCWVVGLNDARSEEKIRGMTLAGGLVNEATLAPEDAFDQIIDRASVTGAQLLADFNPDSPYHWMMRKFLSAELPSVDLKRWRFNLYDNPVLSQEYIDRLNRMHAPGSLWHRRMVLGEWVAAEGAIFDMLDTRPGGAHVVSELPENFERVVAGIDYGTSNPTVFLAVGKLGSTWTVFSEHRHDGREGGQRTDAEHSAAFRRWVERLGISPSSVELDPSAASFKVQLKRDGVRKVYDAENEVLDGIRLVSTALTDGTLKIHESCQGLLSEMSTYAWDAKAQDRGEDKPLKLNDHGPDTLRYIVQRIYGKQPQRALRLVR